MKDKERILLVIKIYLDLHGVATAKEISDYLQNCPAKFIKYISPVTVAGMLKGQKWVITKTDEKTRKKTYQVKVV